MRKFLTLFARETKAYFYSPIAYVVLAIFLAVTGHLFYLTLELLTARGPKGVSYPMEQIVNGVPFTGDPTKPCSTRSPRPLRMFSNGFSGLPE